ncbi:MAG: DUF4236 domain-containing protein [Alphaproteobacteria bacterium]|nr:DUF4236 domain-containing protein [Alphaproteobacteria bacterium]
MGLRFHKSIRLIPGLRLNLSKSGPSLSVGQKGMSFNVGGKKTRTTVGIPGSGLSYISNSSYKKGIGKKLFWFFAIAGYTVYKYLQKHPEGIDFGNLLG